MKSYHTEAPALSLVLKHPWLWVSTFFGAGCITPAPGTWGSFAAWPVFWLLSESLGRGSVWILLLAVSVLGVIAVNRSAPLLKKVDHGSIVIDEVAAVWLVLLLTPLGFLWQLVSVIAFRFFDIVKLPPVSMIDALPQNGFTVMGDDFFAAAYAVLTVNVVAVIIQSTGLNFVEWMFY